MSSWATVDDNVYFVDPLSPRDVDELGCGRCHWVLLGGLEGLVAGS